MNFLLVDDSDKVIARSRSLAALREKHAGASQQDYAKQSQLTTGARSWVFGDLPERQESREGRQQVGYPALVDEGPTVGLRAFATAPEARASHERGTARLIRLVLARDLKPLRKDLAVNVQGEMVYKALAPHPLLDPNSRRAAICARTCSIAW
jgi:ATP-dependent helicase HrpA